MIINMIISLRYAKWCMQPNYARQHFARAMYENNMFTFH